MSVPQFQWANPWAFSLLAFLIAAAVWMYIYRHKRRPTLQFSSLRLFASIRPTFRVYLQWLPTAFLMGAVGLMIVALARPQETSSKIKRSQEGIDIMLTLDISDSMLIEDMQPTNRIESAKKVLVEFVKSRPSDRIGLVVFMGEAYTRVPMTLDHELLIKSIQELKPSRNMKMGTAIGSSLALTVARLKDSTAKSRVTVFATDGENNSGTIDPETALEMAKGFGIRIYAIGIGKDGDAQLPIESIDAFGRKVKRYQPIHSSVNDELLGKMASETGGKYFRATTSGALRQVFQDIDRLEKSKIESQNFVKYNELFPKYLKAALVLLFIGLVLQASFFARHP